jgi:hypothetical protein
VGVRDTNGTLDRLAETIVGMRKHVT